MLDLWLNRTTLFLQEGDQLLIDMGVYGLTLEEMEQQLSRPGTTYRRARGVVEAAVNKPLPFPHDNALALLVEL